MKKISVLVLSFVMAAVMLAACRSPQSVTMPNGSTVTIAPTTTAATETTAPRETGDTTSPTKKPDPTVPDTTGIGKIAPRSSSSFREF